MGMKKMMKLKKKIKNLTKKIVIMCKRDENVLVLGK